MFVILKTSIGKELDNELYKAFAEEILYDDENSNPLPFSPDRIQNGDEVIWLFPRSQWNITGESLTIHGSRNSVRSILNRLDDEFTDSLKYRESSVIAINSSEKDWKWYDSLGTKFREKIPPFHWRNTDDAWRQFTGEYTSEILGEYLLANQLEAFLSSTKNFKWIVPKGDRDYERASTWYSRSRAVLDNSGRFDLYHKRAEISELLTELYAAKFGIWV